MQLSNYNNKCEKPIYEKIYKICRIIRFGKCKSKSNWLCDIEGNFNLMCVSKRAIRLLNYIKSRKLNG